MSKALELAAFLDSAPYSCACTNDASEELRRQHEEIEALRAELRAIKEQEPVAWVNSLEAPSPHCVTDLKYCSAHQVKTGSHLEYIPLYLLKEKQ